MQRKQPTNDVSSEDLTTHSMHSRWNRTWQILYGRDRPLGGHGGCTTRGFRDGLARCIQDVTTC